MDQQCLRALREAELSLVKPYFPPGLRVLEIGGGSGFQADILASWGCDVASIDLPEVAATAKEHQVQSYDGKHIPFADHTFDVVFSSNVLEHVPHLTVILNEIARVTKVDGMVVHILPSSAWRFWTIVTHYAHLTKRVVGLIFRRDEKSARSCSQASSANRGWRVLLRRVFLDGPHGVYPNEFYELYAFSRSRWLHVFQTHGFEVTRCFSSGLFYTGYAIFPRLSIDSRRRLSRYLGSATRIYAMRPLMQGRASS